MLKLRLSERQEQPSPEASDRICEMSTAMVRLSIIFTAV